MQYYLQALPLIIIKKDWLLIEKGKNLVHFHSIFERKKLYEFWLATSRIYLFSTIVTVI